MEKTKKVTITLTESVLKKAKELSKSLFGKSNVSRFVSDLIKEEDKKVHRCVTFNPDVFEPDLSRIEQGSDVFNKECCTLNIDGFNISLKGLAEVVRIEDLNQKQLTFCLANGSSVLTVPLYGASLFIEADIIEEFNRLK